MESKDLTEVLRKHSLWLRGESTGARANLRGDSLQRADLQGADLQGTDLRGADLPETKAGQVCRLDFGGWSICVRHDKTQIGCKLAGNEKWLSWEPKDVAMLDPKAEQWWQQHGEAIKAVIRCVMKKAEGLSDS